MPAPSQRDPGETTPDEPHDVASSEREVARLQFLLRTVADALLIFDDDGTVRWASDSLESVSGWTLADLRRIDPLSLVHPDDADAALEFFLDAVAGRGIAGTVATCRLRSAEGSWRWVDIDGINLRDEPLIGGLLMIIRDASARVDAERALRSSERRFEALVRNSNDWLTVADADLNLTYVSPAIERLLGFEPGIALSAPFGAGLVEPDMTRLLEAYRRAIEDPGRTFRAQVRVPHADGGIRWIESVLSSHLDDPDVRGVVASSRDITEQHELLEELQSRNARVEAAERASRRLASVFNQTNDLAVLLDHRGHVTYLNSATQQFLGISAGELDQVLGRRFDPLHEHMAQIFADSARGSDAPQWSGEITLSRHDGIDVPMLLQVIQHRTASGDVEYYSAVARDISDRKAMEQSLHRQATHDPLTGLPNRALLYERLERALDGLDSLASSHSVALLFIDIDHFKVVNDSLGHAVGDELLCVIAERLRSVVRPGDTVARFGGDEFVVLCERMDHPEDAVVIAHRVEVSLSEPITVAEHESRVGVSIGIAYADPEDRDATAILRDADTAMYRAKSDGRGRWVIFDEKLRHQAVERQSVESALRRTRHGDDLQLHYQPVVDLATNEIIGVEALVRWCVDGEVMAPESFIPIAEETGLIVPIGTWVMETATRQIARWQQSPGWSDLHLAVNVSARQLLHPTFVSSVQSCLAESGIAAGSLSIEITESVLLDDVNSARAQLERLRELGLGVALDDFGTGYSSLTYLHRLPANVVKLDRSFVAGVGADPGDTAIVTAVVNLATALGLTCVAEGIETLDQLERLRDLGCGFGQGYYLSQPVPGEEFEELFLTAPLTTLPVARV